MRANHSEILIPKFVLTDIKNIIHTLIMILNILSGTWGKKYHHGEIYMPKREYVVFLFFILFTIIYTPAHAIQHEIRASVSGRFTDWEVEVFSDEGDMTTLKSKAGYIYYFDSIKHKSLPIDLLPFLLHPSRIQVDLYGGWYEYVNNLTDHESDKDWLGIRAGGIFYLPSDTGLGGYIRYENGDWKDNKPWKYDEDEFELAIQCDQYFKDKHNIRFSLNRISEDRTFDNGDKRDATSDWVQFGYKGAYGSDSRFVVDFRAGIGRTEVKEGNVDNDWRLYHSGVAMGPALRHHAIYLAIDYTKEDGKDPGTWDNEEWKISLQPRIWFSPNFLLGFDLSYILFTQTRDDVWEREFKGPQIGINFAARF